MTIQVHVPPGQASGSGSIWHSHRAQVLALFSGAVLMGAREVGGVPHVSVCTLKFQASLLQQPGPPGGDQKQREKGRQGPPGRPPRSQPPPRSSRGPRTMRPPAPAALTTQVSAPSAPARLVLAMAAPPAQARGCC